MTRKRVILDFDPDLLIENILLYLKRTFSALTRVICVCEKLD